MENKIYQFELDKIDKHKIKVTKPSDSKCMHDELNEIDKFRKEIKKLNEEVIFLKEIVNRLQRYFVL